VRGSPIRERSDWSFDWPVWIGHYILKCVFSSQTGYPNPIYPRYSKMSTSRGPPSGLKRTRASSVEESEPDDSLSTLDYSSSSGDSDRISRRLLSALPPTVRSWGSDVDSEAQYMCDENDRPLIVHAPLTFPREDGWVDLSRKLKEAALSSSLALDNSVALYGIEFMSAIDRWAVVLLPYQLGADPEHPIPPYQRTATMHYTGSIGHSCGFGEKRGRVRLRFDPKPLLMDHRLEKPDDFLSCGQIGQTDQRLWLYGAQTESYVRLYFTNAEGF